MSEARESRSIVVKVGTAVLTGGAAALDRGYLHDLASEVAALHRDGSRVLIVSSGAVGAGVGALRLPGRPSDVGQLQAAASAGQPLLMAMWIEALSARGLTASQILLSRDDFDTRERFLNIRNCVGALFAFGAVPIVNENDTVATQEISLGDNDVLAARLAVAVRASTLVILTTGPGVLDEQDEVVRETADADSLRRLVRPSRTAQGRGGMATKVEAARIASHAGVTAVIAPGRPAANLGRIMAGDSLGTRIVAADARHAGRRQWIALAATPSGALVVDDGAARALAERGASLLARGVTGVEGRFEIGDVVEVRSPAGAAIGRGLTNFSSDEARLIMGRASREFESILGRQAHEELIHRDNMVVG